MSKNHRHVCGTCNGTGYILVNELAELRKKQNLSQEDMADALNLSRGQLANIESGRSVITSARIRKYAELLGVSVDKILNIQFGDEY